MTLNPANYTIRVEPGDTWIRVVGVKSGGSPVNLTGYTVRMKAWDSEGMDLFVLTDGDGLDVAESTGLITITIGAEETAVMRYVEQGWYRLKLTYPDTTTVRTLLKGRITSNQWDGDLSDDS